MTPATLIVEVDGPDALFRVVAHLRTLGLTRLDALTPYPLHELDELLDLPRPTLPRWTLAGALLGGGSAWLIQWWVNEVSMRTDVGGRPLHAAPMFVPITFELGVLIGAFGTMIGLFLACGFPRLWHPLFEADGVQRASLDAFFVVVDAADPAFDEERVRRALDEERVVRVQTQMEAS